MSPAIDILVSSNLERWLHLLAGSTRVKDMYNSLAEEKYFELTQQEKSLMSESGLVGGWCSDEDCAGIIQEKYQQCGYLLDPHTAVGVAVGEGYKGERPMLVMATAHYSKFWEDVGPLVGGKCDDVPAPPPHDGIIGCLNKEHVHKEEIEPELEILA